MTHQTDIELLEAWLKFGTENEAGLTPNLCRKALAREKPYGGTNEDTVNELLEKKSKPKVFCIHHNDADGLLSAAIVKWKQKANKITSDMEFASFPASYGKPFPEEIIGETGYLYIVDFSYPCEEIFKICHAFNGDILLIDHHKTAIEELEGAQHSPNYTQVLNSKFAGCELTWSTLMPHCLAPKCVHYVADRDLWKFEFGENTKKFHAYLGTIPHTVDAYYEVLSNELSVAKNQQNDFIDGCLKIGESVLTFIRGQIEHDAKRAQVGFMFDFSARSVVMCNATNNISELAHYLLEKYKGAEYAMVWFYDDEKETYHHSLRSRTGSDVDVSEIAKYQGGGGHKHAAGFSIKKGQETRA